MISNFQILMQKGNYNQLLESLEKIHIQNEKDLECLFFLGRVHYQLNNPKESLFFFKKYNQLRPNNILILFNIAMILQNLGKVKESEKIYEKIINQSPNEVRAYYGLFNLNEKNIDE